jgi:hypothetical protein
MLNLENLFIAGMIAKWKIISQFTYSVKGSHKAERFAAVIERSQSGYCL